MRDDPLGLDALATRRGGQVTVVRFEEVPEQVTLESATERRDEDMAFEQETDELAIELDVPVETEEIVSHDSERAIANYVRNHGMNLGGGEWQRERFHGEFVGEDVDWYMKHVGSDLMFVRDRGVGDVDEIAVIGGHGPDDPEVLAADAIARAHEASLRFLYAVGGRATDARLDRVEEYHRSLLDRCSVPVEYELVRLDDREAGLLAAAEGADTAVTTSPHHVVSAVVFGTLPDRLATGLDCTVVLIHENEPRRHTFLRHLLKRLAF